MVSIITRYVVDDDGRVYCRASARASCGGPQASGRIIVRHARGALWHFDHHCVVFGRCIAGGAGGCGGNRVFFRMLIASTGHVPSGACVSHVFLVRGLVKGVNV